MSVNLNSFNFAPSMIVATVFAVIAAYSSPLQAQDLKGLTGIATLNGNCERLVMAGKAFTSGCRGKIVQTIYSSGRTGFTVVVGDNGTAVTFSGIEGAKPDDDTQLQSVDVVILNLNIKGVPPSSSRARGSCAYSNPYKGAMTISCQAVDKDKKAYLLQFRTDGNPPELLDLTHKSEKNKQSAVFDIGPWVGAPLKDDPDHGCLMSMNVNPKISILVYANGNEGFSLSIHNDAWNFDPNSKIVGELQFDGTTYPVSSIEVRNPKTLTLNGGAEEDSVEGTFAASSELLFRIGNQQIKAKFKNNKEAVAKLWSCVSN